MKQYKNPDWWNEDHDSAWERAREAFRRDWDQTKHDFGGDEPDTHQKIRNTVKQATGKEPIPPRRQPVYEDVEPAYRFGYGARAQFGDEYSDWNDELESRLKHDWDNLSTSRKENWERDRRAIRHGWDYELDEDEEMEKAETD